MKKVLYCNVPILKLAGISKICKECNVELVQVSSEHYHNSIASTLDNRAQNKPVKDCKALPGEMILFSGFQSNELDSFLDKYKVAGLPAFLYKAVVTPYNITWSFAYLYEELCKVKCYF